MQLIVEQQSAANKKFLTITGVLAKPANITLRCEIDLSPGIRMIPLTCFWGVMVNLFSIFILSPILVFFVN
jgi:hypothetical protein